MARDQPPRRDRDINRDRDKRRKGHRATDSTGELLYRDGRPREDSESPSPRKTKRKGASSGGGSSSTPLSLDALASLDRVNEKKGWKEPDYDYTQRVREQERRLERERMREEEAGERERKLEERARRRAEKERRRLEREEEDRVAEEERRLEEERLEIERAARQRRDEKERRRSEKGRRKEEQLSERQREKRGGHRQAEDDKLRRQKERDMWRSRYNAPDEPQPRGAERDPYEMLDSLDGTGSSTLRDHNEKAAHYSESEEKRRRKYLEIERAKKKRRPRSSSEHPPRSEKRVISNTVLEKGGSDDGSSDVVKGAAGSQTGLFVRWGQYRGGKGSSGGSSSEYTTETEWQRRRRRRRIFIAVIVVFVALAIIIPVAVVLSQKNDATQTPKSDAMANTTTPANSNLKGVSEDSIPASAKGTILDPFSWYDTNDFNVTYTDATVGGLPIMGLNSTWSDDVQCNSKVPKLTDTFVYGTQPIRGVNVGGWLNLEPFITPSFFEHYSTRDNVIDEYTLCQKLGGTKAKQTLEEHYSSFVSAQTFADIRAAGFDHVRIPFNYWAVTTYDGDPYVPKVAWRYLLRGIEWARQNGLRVNLDLHGLPGSQNGWNHSGRQGAIGWLNGTDGALNAQRSLDIHNQLSQFFSQPRYKNVVTMYGLVNEPRMVVLDTNDVLSWYDKAIKIIQGNNITGILVFGDGFMGLDNWQGKLQGYKNLLLDVHQYVIFNTDQIALEHKDKLSFACAGWTQQSQRSMNKATGFGPTMCGEWSQADTDCQQYINNVGWGNRWEGTLNTGNASTSVLTPTCPTKNNPTCSCQGATADPSQYSDAYKQWLYQFAQAQMESFEAGWGWFYWTWQTEKAPQWSYQAGLKAGILPKLAYERDFKCSDTLSDFQGMGLPENY